jgi:hypothetical protein
MKENKIHKDMLIGGVIITLILVAAFVMFAFVSNMSHHRSQTLVENCVESNGQIIQNENTTLSCLLPPGVLPSDF